MNEALANLDEAFISGYTISLYSYEEMLKEAGDIVITESKLKEEVLSGPGGVNDARMGTLTMTDECVTCSGQNCPGHLGIIKFGLNNEIIHPLFIRTVLKLLNCVCHDCSRVLFCNELGKKNVMSDELKKILKMSPNNEIRLTALEKYCNKIKRCTCDYSSKNCNIKRCSNHLKLKASSINQDEGTIQYKLADEKTENAPKRKIKSTKEDESTKTLFTKQIYNILKNISKEDAAYLGFIGDTQPADLILRGILVIPPQARPPITDKNGETLQNPITSLYIEVVKAVNSKDNSPGKIFKAVRNLLVKNDNHRRGGQEVKSISELMQGKKGIYRFAMMGKRTDWCGRTVAGPGEHLKFGQEAVPQSWSAILTKPRKITHYNIEYYQQLLSLHQISHIIDNKGLRQPIDYTQPLPQLMIGQEVERHLQDKDRIYLNRQPSLHKGSMQGFEIVLEPSNTIKSHLSITTSLNLDHDGDELNAWVPQDYNVESELAYIFNSKECVVSTGTGKANMGLVMNSITALNLLAQSEILEELYFDLLNSLTNKEGLDTLVSRLNKFGFQLFRTDMKGQRWYLGRAAISALFPPNFEYRSKDLNIYEGILVSGIPTKSKGLHSGRSIAQELIKHYSIQRGADFLTDAPFMSNIYLANRGFTVGYKDCLNMVVDSKAEIVNKKYNKDAATLQSLYDDVFDIVFSSKSFSAMMDITNNVDKLIKNITDVSKDAGFKGALARRMKVLDEINNLTVDNDVTNRGRKRGCDLTKVSEVMSKYKDFFEAKKKEKASLVEIRREYQETITEVKEETVSDPLLLKLRLMLNSIEVLHLLVGENPTMWVAEMNNNLTMKVADGLQLMNQVIADIFTTLTNMLNGKKVEQLIDTTATKRTLHNIEKLLKTYQYENIYSLSMYGLLKRNLEQLKQTVVTDDVTNLIAVFFESISAGILAEFMNIKGPKERIVEEDEAITAFYDKVNSEYSDYDKVVSRFIDNVLMLMLELKECSEREMSSKKNAIMGIFNETLLTLIVLVYKNLKNVLNQEYNRNYVIKKEEMSKLMLELEAMGAGEKGLKPEEKQFRELQLAEKMNVAKTIGARLTKEVSKSNAILYQTDAYAAVKGSQTNFSQISAALGQSYLLSQRIWNDKARLSSHYDPYDESPIARGFIEASFMEGLSPTEHFYAGAMSQQTVVESGLNVASVGSLQRRLERSLENYVLAYDGSVRNSQGFLCSASYNNGFNIAKTLSVPTVEKPSLSNFIDINILIDYQNHERGWYSQSEIKKTNIKAKKTKLSLEDEFTDMINDTITPEPIAIHSNNQNTELKITQFEKARIIGTRANQLNNNAIPRIQTDIVEPFDIAKLEYEQGLLAEEPALFIIRTLPNGTQIRVYPTLQNII